MKDIKAEVIMKQTNSIPSMSNTLNFEMIANILYFRGLCFPPKWDNYWI